MTTEFRFQSVDEHSEALVHAQRQECFAGGDRPQEHPPTVQHEWSLWDGDALAASAIDREYHSFFGGVAVPTSGIATVTVAPEYRGRGAARQVMQQVLASARARGAVVSTLFAAAPALYRSLGYELVARNYLWHVPLSSLPTPDSRTDISLHRVSADDERIGAVDHAFAAHGTAVIDRRELTVSEQPSDARVTLAVDADGVPRGYARWATERDGAEVRLRVSDLVGTSAHARRALLASLSTWGSVAREVLIRVGEHDPLLHTLRGNATTSLVSPYMMRLLDVTAAVESRRWNSAAAGTVVIRVHDPLFTDNDATFALTADGGDVSFVHTTRSAHISIDIGGLALWYAGVARLDTITGLGLARGGDRRSSDFLDALAVSPPPAIVEYF